MRHVTACLFGLAALVVSVAHAAEPKVYKWTDESGTVHFSAEPPAAVAAQEVQLDKAPTPTPPSAADVAVTPQPQSAEENAKRCQQHRDNLKLLENAAQPLSINDNGNVRPLNAAERQTQVQAARDALTQCEAAPPTTPAPTAATPAAAPATPPAG